MKKYLLLIPTLFVMLLNVIGCGQVVYAADEDYSIYFADPPSDIIEYMDFTDISEINIFDFPDFSEYYYQVYSDSASYENYCNGITDTISISFLICDFTNSDSFTINEFTTTTTTAIEYRLYHTYYTRNIGYSISSTQSTTMYFYFTPDSGAWGYNSSAFIGINEVVKPNHLTMYVECELFNFGNGSSDNLKVEVEFDPVLTDVFSRKVVKDGKITTLESVNVSITNNSSFPIQYSWFIVSHGEDFILSPDKYFGSPNGKVYSGNPAYAYVKDEWCYLPKYDESDRGAVINTFTPSTWHYISSNSKDDITVSFSQMKLFQNANYDVFVYAVRNDRDSVCVIPYNQSSFQQGYNQEYMIDFLKAELVYYSSFSITDPAEFDSSLNDNGSYAFDPDDRTLFNRASGYIDDNGEVVIKKIDTDKLAYDPNSWGSQYDSDAWEQYYKAQNSVSSDINQLSLNFSSFFRFVNTVFGYFPKNFQSVIVLGLTSCVVLGILKVVF